MNLYFPNFLTECNYRCQRNSMHFSILGIIYFSVTCICIFISTKILKKIKMGRYTELFNFKLLNLDPNNKLYLCSYWMSGFFLYFLDTVPFVLKKICLIATPVSSTDTFVVFVDVCSYMDSMCHFCVSCLGLQQALLLVNDGSIAWCWHVYRFLQQQNSL